MDCSMPGFHVLQYLLEFAQTMPFELMMPSNHLILCCPLLLKPSVFLSIRVFSSDSALHIRWPSIGASASASVQPLNIQRWYPLQLTGLISLLSKGLSRVFSNTTVQKHQFFGAQLSSQSNSHVHTWLLGKTIALTIQAFVSKLMSLLLGKRSKKWCLWFLICYLTLS